MRSRSTTITLLGAIMLATSWIHAAAGQLQIAPPDYDDVFPAKYITQGAPQKSKEQCDATPNAVWIEANWLDKGAFSDSNATAAECIRYFPSDNAIGAKTAILFFSGDIVLQASGGDSTNNPGYGANSYKAQIALANRQAAAANVAYIHVARPGMYGSTGNTAIYRHSVKEAATMSAAVDAVKAALGYERISIVGQSGGGGIAGVLLTSGRTDLDCVSLSSGTVSLKTSLKTTPSKSWVRNGQDTTGLPYRQLYDPLDHLDQVKPDARRRIFMFSDPDDEAVSFISQIEFADRANEKGVPIKQIFTKGAGKQHHGTAAQGIRTAARCLRGMSDEEIAAKIAENYPR